MSSRYDGDAGGDSLVGFVSSLRPRPFDVGVEATHGPHFLFLLCTSYVSGGDRRMQWVDGGEVARVDVTTTPYM